jgi:hypothetical protein
VSALIARIFLGHAGHEIFIIVNIANAFSIQHVIFLKAIFPAFLFSAFSKDLRFETFFS